MWRLFCYYLFLSSPSLVPRKTAICDCGMSWVSSHILVIPRVKHNPRNRKKKRQATTRSIVIVALADIQTKENCIKGTAFECSTERTTGGRDEARGECRLGRNLSPYSDLASVYMYIFGLRRVTVPHQ